jgi:hypothetical protein
MQISGGKLNESAMRKFIHKKTKALEAVEFYLRFSYVDNHIFEDILEIVLLFSRCY